MFGDNGLAEGDLEPALPCAPADVRVLEVHEVPLVEPQPEVPADSHAGAGDPIRVLHGPTVDVSRLAALRPANRLLEPYARTREATLSATRPPRGSENRSGDRRSSIVRRLHESADIRQVDADIGVQSHVPADYWPAP